MLAPPLPPHGSVHDRTHDATATPWSKTWCFACSFPSEQAGPRPVAKLCVSVSDPMPRAMSPQPSQFTPQ